MCTRRGAAAQAQLASGAADAPWQHVSARLCVHRRPLHTAASRLCAFGLALHIGHDDGAQVNPGRQLLSAVGQAMAERASDCNPQEISNTIWAFAKLRARSALLCHAHASRPRAPTSLNFWDHLQQILKGCCWRQRCRMLR